jgi:hypothetical protein
MGKQVFLPRRAGAPRERQRKRIRRRRQTCWCDGVCECSLNAWVRRSLDVCVASAVVLREEKWREGAESTSRESPSFRRSLFGFLVFDFGVVALLVPTRIDDHKQPTLSERRTSSSLCSGEDTSSSHRGRAHSRVGGSATQHHTSLDGCKKEGRESHVVGSRRGERMVARKSGGDDDGDRKTVELPPLWDGDGVGRRKLNSVYPLLESDWFQTLTL